MLLEKTCKLIGKHGIKRFYSFADLKKYWDGWYLGSEGKRLNADSIKMMNYTDCFNSLIEDNYDF
jgi:hypothetical protein